MWMCFRWKRPCRCWLNRFKRAVIVVLGCSVGLAGCTTLTFDSARGPQAQIEHRLRAEPSACNDYRSAYVEGFTSHVQGLSEKHHARKQDGLEDFKLSRRILARNGLSEDDCSRPLCIIEPLQAGKLDSWCGYRVVTPDGPELHQWFEWSTVQP